MNKVYTSIESLVADAEGLSIEASAMKSAIALRLDSPKRRAMDTVLSSIGLESTTLIAEHISEEGVFDWIKGKLSALGRKINVVVNKIYAKITGADQATKDLIAKASTDNAIALPISGKKAAAVLGITAATVAAITLISMKMFGKSDEQKLAGIMAKIKEYQSVLVSADSSEKQQKRAAKNLNSASKKTAKLNENIAKKKEAAGNPAAYKAFLNKASSGFAAVKNAISGFVAKFKSAENSAANEAKKGDSEPAAKKSVWERIKSVGTAIADLFKVVRKWFASLPSMFKRGEKKAA